MTGKRTSLLCLEIKKRMLNEKQQEDCLRIFEDYQDKRSRSKPRGMTFDEWDKKRSEVDSEIRGKIEQYLSGELPLPDFAKYIDSTNRRHNLWAFNTWKGTFYLNMLMTSSERFMNLDQLMKESIAEPKDDNDALKKMEAFYNEVVKVSLTYDDKRTGPSPRSVPYFLSYFWHIQNKEKWYIQYPSSESALEDLRLWDKTGDVVEDASSFLEVIRVIHALYNKQSKNRVSLELVGHIIYNYFLKRQETISKGEEVEGKKHGGSNTSGGRIPPEKRLPDEFIPPVVSILPHMARIDPDIEAICRDERIDLPTEFERRVAIAFSLLGFDVQKKGQGTGREPDIIAKAREYGYALIIDAKARKDSYRIGTDDRQFIEYIQKEVPELRRDQIKKFILAIVSSEFAYDVDPAIRNIRVQTEVHSVVMIRAEDLLSALDLKLKRPEDFDLGDNGFKRLLSKDGIITREEILEALGS